MECSPSIPKIGINGYWAQLTRTFFAQSINREWQRVQRACVAAQDAALKVIREGALARDVDATARQVIQDASFGDAFKHGLGHGSGFQAINHAAIPILHPTSNTVLRSGMVHTIEPAVYLEGKGGFRLNDDVVVRPDGSEVLSSALPRYLDWLIVKK
jgi:Xaa-Pro aminopeptidase